MKSSPLSNDPVTSLEAILVKIFPTSSFDDGVKETAERVIRMWTEFKPEKELSFEFTVFPTTVNQMIIVRGIEFSSLCSHHLLPFSGVAHVAYLPNKLMVGLSKIPRLVHFFATRPQTQETLTRQIASDLKRRLEAQGVAVVIRSTHTCMSCRGVRSVNAEMITSEMRGTFLTGHEARNEFLTLISQGGI